MSDSLWPHGLQHPRLPCPSPTPGACSNSCPLSGDDIQPSHPLSSPLLLRSIFRSIRAFPLSQFFASGGQSIESFTYSQNLWVVGWSRLGVIYYIKKKIQWFSVPECSVEELPMWMDRLRAYADAQRWVSIMEAPLHLFCVMWSYVQYLGFS